MTLFRPDVPDLGFDHLLDLVASEENVDTMLDRAIEALAVAARSAVAAVLVLDEGRLVHERWWPAMAERESGANVLRAVAKDVAAGGDVATVAQRLGAQEGLLLMPLSTADRTLGLLAFVPVVGAAPHGDHLRRLHRALAKRLATDLELARSRGMLVRYERWFKTLDEQLRLLDRERQKFAAIVHASDAAVFVVDPERRVGWTNSVLAQHPPTEGATWIGMSCHALCREFAGGDRSCAACPVERAFADRVVAHHEFQQASGGRSLYLTALPIKRPDGLPDEVMVMIQDLSDLQILRTSESRYRLLFERSGRGILMVDPNDRRVLLANETAAELTGYPVADLMQIQLDTLHAEAEWWRLEASYLDAMVHGDLASQECRIRRRDGSERVTSVSGTRTSLDGRSVLMLEFRDLTESRRFEEALQLAEARLQVVVAGSPVILFAMDRNGVFTLSEGRGLATLGLEPGQVVGQSIFTIYQDAPQVLQQARRALDGEEFTHVVDLGTSAWETSYASLRDDDGQVRGVIGVATDVTERLRLEGQLRQAQRMEAIGRLAGGVAHDFNNLLAAILGHTELMMRRIESDHPLRPSTEEILKAASRGAMLTRQLLAFGRKDTLSIQGLDCNAAVSGMEALLRRLIGEDIELVTEGSTEPAWVRADRGQIEQVLMNLVVNARDAMPQGGRVTVTVAGPLDEAAPRPPHMPDGPYVHLCVRDTGVGMSTETMAHIFEPFFTTKPRDQGTGLGLATVYGIVEQNGGVVRVDSEPGQGAGFHVFLPAVAPPAEAQDLTPSIAPPQGGSEVILLVEDEEGVRRMVAEVLESHGYRVLLSGDGVEALEVAAAHQDPIDLLVTDVVMPRMGGGELAIRMLERQPDVRILFMSGYPDDAIVRQGVLEARSELLQKPFGLDDLARRIRGILDSPQARAA